MQYNAEWQGDILPQIRKQELVVVLKKKKHDLQAYIRTRDLLGTKQEF